VNLTVRSIRRVDFPVNREAGGSLIMGVEHRLEVEARNDDTLDRIRFHVPEDSRQDYWVGLELEVSEQRHIGAP